MLLNPHRNPRSGALHGTEAKEIKSQVHETTQKMLASDANGPADPKAVLSTTPGPLSGEGPLLTGHAV